MKRPKGWTPDTYYRLGDKHSSMKSFFDFGEYATIPKKGTHVKAIWDGEYRTPKKGEWYLSGCEGFVFAYRAPSDFVDINSNYFIVKIVEVETKTWTTTQIVKPLDN